MLLLAGLPGSRRREVPAWEQRIAAARATLEQAQGALAVAQEAYNARLPAAEREARQMAEDGRRQLAALQGRIEERAGLIQRAKAAQEAERERLNAEARTRAAGSRAAEDPRIGSPAGGATGAEARTTEICYIRTETETPISRARRVSAS